MWANGRRVAKDVMLLEKEKQGEATKSRWKGALPVRTLGDRLAPYSCYGTVNLYGPAIQETLHYVSQQCETISVRVRLETPRVPNLTVTNWPVILPIPNNVSNRLLT